MSNKIYWADNLDVLRLLPDESIDLVYTDPPFNTGKTQKRQNKKMSSVVGTGDQEGFAGKQYVIKDLGEVMSYQDAYYGAYLQFLSLRLKEIHRVLKPSGSLYLHLDYRESAYARVVGDSIFGRENYLNEIIWAYDYGGKPKDRWPAKHDNIHLWVKSKGNHFFTIEDIDRIPYMAPGMVSEEKAIRGKRPTSTWWHTIVSPTGKEKTGYPTQKPLGLAERIVRASSPLGGTVLDIFGGSGTVGEAALKNNRNFILVDSNKQAIGVMRSRFSSYMSDGHKIKFINKMERKNG